MFGKGRKPEIRICHTYDRAHVRKKGVSLEVVYSLSRRKLAAVCLGGSQSDLLLWTPHRTNAVESSDLLKRLQIYSHSLGKLKSLYEYLIGKHIHKLIRKSVPYACSPWVELGFVCWIAYIKCTPLESRVVLVSKSVAVAFINGIHSENWQR
jgi:hypothetical protein